MPKIRIHLNIHTLGSSYMGKIEFTHPIFLGHSQAVYVASSKNPNKVKDNIKKALKLLGNINDFEYTQLSSEILNADDNLEEILEREKNKPSIVELAMAGLWKRE